ncbi:MAG: hypothetical protein ACRC46_06330 [Thermoguttaceae bacterium]
MLTTELTNNTPESYICFLAHLFFLLFSIAMAFFSWLMYWDSGLEYPQIMEFMLRYVSPLFLLLWYCMCCTVSCMSGLMIRPLFFNGQVGLRRFMLISWLYRVVLILFVCFLIMSAVVAICSMNGYDYPEKYVGGVANVFLNGVTTVLLFSSLISFSVIMISLRSAAWLIGNLFSAIACVGAGLTLVFVLSQI